MKITVAVDYEIPRQREWAADIKLTNEQVRAIVTDYFNKMDYKERQAWIASNIKTRTTISRRLL